MRGAVDAVLFDAGGVLVLPDPAVLAPALGPYGGAPEAARHERAHYGAMAAKARAQDAEDTWATYDLAYVRLVGVPAHDEAEAAFVLGRTRHAHLWRAPVAGARDGLAALHAAGVPIGVVSNASGQIASVLARVGICQVGPGPGVPVRVVVDSHDVGVAKPDPAIFRPALDALGGIAPGRIAYVGDSVSTDVAAARAAGMVPVLVDPYDDWHELDAVRISGLADLVALLGG